MPPKKMAWRKRQKLGRGQHRAAQSTPRSPEIGVLVAWLPLLTTDASIERLQFAHVWEGKVPAPHSHTGHSRAHFNVNAPPGWHSDGRVVLTSRPNPRFGKCGIPLRALLYRLRGTPHPRQRLRLLGRPRSHRSSHKGTDTPRRWPRPGPGSGPRGTGPHLAQFILLLYLAQLVEVPEPGGDVQPPVHTLLRVCL